MPRSAAVIKFAVRKLIAGRGRGRKSRAGDHPQFTTARTTTTTMARQIFITF